MELENFDCLDCVAEWKELREILILASENIERDSNTSLYKLRAFSERLVKLIIKYENLDVSEYLDLKESLETLKKNRVITPDVFSKLDCLRTIGNIAVHDNCSNKNVAKANLLYAKDLSEWFSNNYKEYAMSGRRKTRKNIIKTIKAYKADGKYLGVFEGELLQGRGHGKGRLTYESRVVDEGEFYDYWKLDGEGKRISPLRKSEYGSWLGGWTYEGMFVNGSMTGKGKMTNEYKDVIEGISFDGGMYGYSKIVYSDGSKYEGQIFCDKPHGKGILYKYDGTIIEGYWMRGEQINPNTTSLINNIINSVKIVEGKTLTEEKMKKKEEYTNDNMLVNEGKKIIKGIMKKFIKQ